MIISIIGYIMLGGLAAIGLATVVSYFQHRSKLSGGPVKYARLRLEWESRCVTYKTVPYNSDKMLDTLLALASTINMRKETSTEGTRLVQDKVKAVTVVHNNWPAPTATDAERA